MTPSRRYARPPRRAAVGPGPTRTPIFGHISPPPAYQPPSERHSPSSPQAVIRPNSILRSMFNPRRAVHGLPSPRPDPQTMHDRDQDRQPSRLGGLTTTDPLSPAPSPAPGTWRFVYYDHLVELQSCPQDDPPQECMVDFYGSPRRGLIFRGEVFVSLGMTAGQESRA